MCCLQPVHAALLNGCVVVWSRGAPASGPADRLMPPDAWASSSAFQCFCALVRRTGTRTAATTAARSRSLAAAPPRLPRPRRPRRPSPIQPGWRAGGGTRRGGRATCGCCGSCVTRGPRALAAGCRSRRGRRCVGPRVCALRRGLLVLAASCCLRGSVVVPVTVACRGPKLWLSVRVLLRSSSSGACFNYLTACCKCFGCAAAGPGSVLHAVLVRRLHVTHYDCQSGLS